MKNETYVKLSRFRLPRNNGPYWERVLKDFCNIACEKMGASYAEIGKQDIRGMVAITFCTDSHCVIKQEHFESTGALLGYCVGYLHALGEI